MKALSVRQPWAWAIVDGRKDVENRTWRTHHRGPVLIHAGRGLRGDDVDACASLLRRGLDDMPDEAWFGGIVGIAEIVDCVRDSRSKWATPGCWHWILRNARPLPFREVKGMLGLFEVRDKVVARDVTLVSIMP